MQTKKKQQELQIQIQTLNNELLACKNIEKQHKLMNGKLYEEVDKLKKELEQVKKENAIFKENLQAELLRRKIKK